MPFIIKSTGNQRTCTLVKNTVANKTNTTREDLIEALKGLTFKFEVKIIDVEVDKDTDQSSAETTKTTTSNDNGHPQRMNNGFTPINNSAVVEPPKPEIQQKRVTIDVSQENPAPSVRVDEEYRAPRFAHETPKNEPIKEEPVKREEHQPRRYDIEPMKAMIPPSVQLNQIRRQTSIDSQKNQERISEKENIPESCNEWSSGSSKMEPNEKSSETDKVESNKRPHEPAMVETNQPAYRAPSPIRKSAELAQEKSKIPVKAPLIRGTMNIGSSVNTCCISFDTTDQMPCVAFNKDHLLEITKLTQECAQDIEDQSEVVTLEEGDIVFAKSHEDDNWYRGRVESADGNISRIFFFDWGFYEDLGYNRIRRLTQANLGLSRYPACSLRVQFTNEPDCEMLNEALKCEDQFTMDVISYDEQTQTYTCKITDMKLGAK